MTVTDRHKAEETVAAAAAVDIGSQGGGWTPLVLEPLPGHSYTALAGLDESGTAVGISCRVFGRRNLVPLAVRWDEDGVPVPLDLPDGASTSRAEAVNRDGVAVGTAYGGAPVAVRWYPDGTLTDLEQPENCEQSYAVAINDGGTALGWANTSVEGSPVSTQQLLTWDPEGGAATLSIPDGYENAFVEGINGSGVVIGTARLTGTTHDRAMRWAADGDAVDLTALVEPAAGAGSVHGVNDRGSVIGTALTVDDAWRAVRWDRHGHVTELVAPEGGRNPSPCSVNEREEVVGYATTADDVPHAVRWDRHGGVTVLPDLGHGGSAAAVDEHGTVVGRVIAEDGTSRPVLWTRRGDLVELPLPEGHPSCQAGLIAGRDAIGGSAGSFTDRLAVLWRRRSRPAVQERG